MMTGYSKVLKALKMFKVINIPTTFIPILIRYSRANSLPNRILAVSDNSMRVDPFSIVTDIFVEVMFLSFRSYWRLFL